MGLLFPNVAYASESIDQFVSNLDRLIVNPLIVLLFGLALVYFLYGVFEFLSNQEKEEKRSEGKSHMIWGIVGMTVMIAVFFLMNLILRTFNIKGIDPEKGTVELNNYAPKWPR